MSDQPAARDYPQSIAPINHIEQPGWTHCVQPARFGSSSTA
ncbi:MAG TPA: hypothetical protein VI029_05735 [Mycobacterium sp.]